jgi:hypothetical protein
VAASCQHAKRSPGATLRVSTRTAIVDPPPRGPPAAAITEGGPAGCQGIGPSARARTAPAHPCTDASGVHHPVATVATVPARWEPTDASGLW